MWFRGKDLRLSDHEPLRDAVESGEVIPLFVLDPYFFAPERACELPHRMQFLLESLQSLAESLLQRGSRLILVAGRSVEVIPRLVVAWRADRVVAHRWVEPFGRERDRRIHEAIGDRLQLYEGETLLPPGTLRTATGKPYAVFSQFARAFRRLAVMVDPVPAPPSLPPIPDDITAHLTRVPELTELGLRHNAAILRGGERAANDRLQRFVRETAPDYAEQRDRMDLAGTSRLSIDLKFGTLSVRHVWTKIERSLGETQAAQTFLNELVWREFAYSTLWDRPELLDRPFKPAFAAFPWLRDDSAWNAWVEGNTGYPIVDASARQLLHEGFVHNRARIISASFLTKHLLIDFRRGETHYMKYLADGDWANNDMGWQWSAGCGCDAQPYFRIFNPVTQGQRFDPNGDYVRRWVPELSHLPARFIHRPWEAPDDLRRAAGVQLGQSYPHPIVEHHFARERFLALAGQHLKATPSRRGITKKR